MYEFERQIKYCDTLKIGDTFIINKDIRVSEYCDTIEEMLHFAGQSFIISKIDSYWHEDGFKVKTFSSEGNIYVWSAFHIDTNSIHSIVSESTLKDSGFTTHPLLPDI